MASQFQLIMRSGPTPGAAFTLEGDQLTIGRDSTNEIVINDAEVSRRHSRLTFQGGKYVLEDLGSTNGTFVNGQRLAGPRVLKAGEVVSFGEQIVLVFEAVNIDPGATMVSPRAAAVPVSPRRCCSSASGTVRGKRAGQPCTHRWHASQETEPCADLYRRRRFALYLRLCRVLLVGGQPISLVYVLPVPGWLLIIARLHPASILLAGCFV
jgi:predicted component of type VI protein secretion system